MTVQRILNARPTRGTSCVLPDATIAEALQSPGFESTGAVIVSSDGKTIEGIVSERDIVRGLATMGPALLDRPLRDLMTVKVLTCLPTDRVAGVMALMLSKQVRHLPVVTGGTLVDMVSIVDLLQLRLNEVLSDAEAMQKYIDGSA